MSGPCGRAGGFFRTPKPPLGTGLIRDKLKTKTKHTEVHMTRAGDQEMFYLGHSANSESELFLVAACRHQFASLVERHVLVRVKYMIGFSDAEVAPLTSITVRACPLQNCPRQAALGLLVRQLPNILGQLRRVGIPLMPHARFVCCTSSLELTDCQPDVFLRGVGGSYCCFIYYIFGSAFPIQRAFSLAVAF